MKKTYHRPLNHPDPRLIPVQTWVDQATYDALTIAAKAAGVTVQKLASETLTVSMGGNRTCAIS